MAPVCPLAAFSFGNSFLQPTVDLFPDATPATNGTASETGVAGAPPLFATYFGKFEIYRADRAVIVGWSTLASRIACYLIARMGLPVQREELIDWLWPNIEVRLASHRLQVAVSELRRQLDAPGTPVTVVRFEGGAYSIKDDAIVTDCDLFERCYRRAQDYLMRRDLTRAAAELTTAVALYGADYLADAPYAEWAQRRRAYFVERHLNVLAFLCDIAAAQGRHELTIEFALRILETDNLRERAHRHLMRAHYRLGQRACALRHYHTCEEILWRELSIRPSQATQVLYRAIVDEVALPAEPSGREVTA
jgi:DNA-binding SARP family transcriptional activator